jgi:hypothetical protein
LVFMVGVDYWWWLSRPAGVARKSRGFENRGGTSWRGFHS